MTSRSSTPATVCVRIPRAGLEQRAGAIIGSLEHLECIDLKPADVADDDVVELRVTTLAVGQEELVVGVLRARGVEVLASRTIAPPRWHRP